MISLISIETPKFTGHPKVAIYEIKLATGSSVFMKYVERHRNKDKYGVVIVNATKFHELWKLDPNPIDEHKVLSHGKRNTWRNDRKFHSKDEEFSRSKDNPISLAEVYCGTATKKVLTVKTRRKFLIFSKRIGSLQQIHHYYIAISGGLTRTVWLLSKGVASFPVECRMLSAKHLFEEAGQEGSNFYIDESLFK